MDHYLDIDGLRIRYRMAGEGTAVLLLHGWAATIDSLYPVFQAISQSFRAVALDLPGHGNSDPPRVPWHVSDYLACVLKFMDRLSLERPHLLAHSFGGRIAIKLAAHHPHRAGKLLLAAAAGVPPVRTLRRRLRRWAGLTAGRLQSLARKVPGTDGLVRRVNARLLPRLASRDYLNAGPLRETLIHIVSEDLTFCLPKISSQALLIWGDRDQETPLSSGRKMAELIPASELVVFTGAGHFPFLDQAHKFNLLALKFFREHD